MKDESGKVVHLMINKYVRKWILAFVLCLMLAAGISQTAQAYTYVDTEKPVSLTLQFENEEVKFEDVEFELYRVADLSETAEFTLTEDFSGYSIALDHMDSESWRELANTLAASVKRDQIQPIAVSKTNYAGTAVFSEVKAGLYLVTGQPYQRDAHTTYNPAPLILTLPVLNPDDEWEYRASAEIKYEIIREDEENPKPTIQPTVTPAPKPDASKSNAPRTGDSSRPVLYLVIMIVSALTAGFFVVRKVRKSS